MHPQAQDEVCEVCQRTLPDLILRRRYMHNHQPSLRALETSSECGCKSCAVLYHNFVYTGYKEENLYDGTVAVGRSSKEDCLKVMLSGSDTEVAYGTEIPFHVDQRQQDLQGANLHTVKTRLSAAADTIDDVGLVKSLLQDCLMNHPVCTAAGEDNNMPTRLLDVTPSADLNVVRIVSGADVRGDGRRYVCLSHCWGFVPADAPWKLMEARKESYMTEISMNILPLTFKQAIQYTRDLGEKYLWIDSLCIIQDSADDWAAEASRMASIYTNSLVTLSAASASSSEGCILKRDPKIVDPVVLSLEPQVDGGRIAYLFHSVPDERQLQLSVPVAKRAWCLQERRLTVRAIQFTPYQWTWTCRTATTSERILRKLNITADTFNMQGQTGLTFHGREDTSGTKATRGDGVVSDEANVKHWKDLRKDYDAYYKMVEDFSQCDITYASDRLPAFAGLAQRQQDRVPDNYLAGLWEKDILHGLMWKSNNPPPSRPTAYIAPSWSWAGLNSSVGFEGFLHYPDRFSPKLITASVTHRSKDTLGMVTAGHLRLSGYMKPILTAPMPHFEKTQFRRTFRYILPDLGHGTVLLDTDADAEDTSDIMCLSVLDGRGIALKPMVETVKQERPAFRRVGSCTFLPGIFENISPIEFDLY